MNKWFEIDNKTNDAAIVVSTRIRLARNLSDIPFPNRMNEEQKRDVINRVAAALEGEKFGKGIGLELVDMEKIDDISANAMAERRTLSPEFAKNRNGRAIFLSKDENDVQRVMDSGICASALIYAPPTDFNPEESRVKIAFDADAVIFSDESECRFKKEGFDAFYKYEKENADVPLKEGPFATLLKKLSQIQECLPTSIELSPLRLAIVTSRSLPSHFRVIKTLRKWGVYVDEAYFLGGLRKDELLKAFGAHIFFDDQDTHLSSSSKYVPSGKVPYYSDSQMNEVFKERERKKTEETE